MKLARHEKIIELIKEYDIDTQEELAARLNEAGFKVTQATVSRDIRALKMTKVAGKDGKSRYAILQDTQPGLGDQYTRVLNDAVVSIEVGQNLVVIKTVTGMAMGVATALDALKWPEILGCIAGDDTIMCACKSSELAEGVMEKLDYLHGLGVTTLYFCPIFEAAENHRYGTADYSRIDPMLGCEEDFSQLCRKAHSLGMRVMLDGVFNHTGFVSRYFNGDGFYPEPGAHQSQDSPWYSWYSFQQWPDRYESWWGIYTLPAVNEHDPSYREFIFGGENSVVRRWLRAGADGWRLDRFYYPY